MMFLLLLSYSGLHSGVTMMARILFSQTMNSSTEVTLQGGNVFSVASYVTPLPLGWFDLCKVPLSGRVWPVSIGEREWDQ